MSRPSLRDGLEPGERESFAQSIRLWLLLIMKMASDCYA
jgi:hypothetical protein